MEINLTVLVQIITIVLFVCGIINYVILKPLSQAIAMLNITISELKAVVEKVKENQHDIDKRLGILEEKIEVINHRISDLEKR